MNTPSTCLPSHGRTALRNRTPPLPHIANRRTTNQLTPSLDETPPPYPHFSNNKANHTLTLPPFPQNKTAEEKFATAFREIERAFRFFGLRGRGGVAMERGACGLFRWFVMAAERGGNVKNEVFSWCRYNIPLLRRFSNGRVRSPVVESLKYTAI